MCDYMKQLNKTQSLEVLEMSCVYCKTLTMKEAKQLAFVELSYSSLVTFKEAVDQAKCKKIEWQDCSTLLDWLVIHFDALLLYNVDSVVIHHDNTIIRFQNTTKQPTNDSCSIALAYETVYKYYQYVARQAEQKAKFDFVPVIIAGACLFVAVVLSRIKFN